MYSLRFTSIPHQTTSPRIATPPVAGVFQIYGAQWDYFKDAETINLDGLPEAEALSSLKCGRVYSLTSRTRTWRTLDLGSVTMRKPS